MVKRICAFPYKGKYYLSQIFDGDLPEQKRNGIPPTVTGEWKQLVRCYFTGADTLEKFFDAVFLLEEAFGYDHKPLQECSSLPNAEELWMQADNILMLCGRYRRTTSARVPFHLDKHASRDGTFEYIDARDIFQSWGEFDQRVQKAFEFLSLVEEQLNYFNDHTSTAFGNPDFARIEGKVTGYRMAMGWEWHEDDSEIRIINKLRTVFVIQKPKLPQWELDAREEISELMSSL